jgi:CHAD domain-containing protein
VTHAHEPAESGKPAPTAGAYVLAKLRELDASLTETAPRVLAQETDDEAIHDLRVAIRRMRTLLKMSRKLFGRWHTDVVRGAFADVMRATGELRDEEVLEETLEGAAEAPEFAAWLKGRKTRETKLRHAVTSRLQRGDLDRARLLLKALLVFPVEPDRNVDLSRFARRTVERARRKVESKRDVEVTDVAGMHDLRIAYKELRYSIELLAEALPIDARAQLEPATVFQRRLGELHDVDVAIEVIQTAKGLSSEVRHEALASLATLRKKRVHKYLRELDPLGAAEKKKAAHTAEAVSGPGRSRRNGGARALAHAPAPKGAVAGAPSAPARRLAPSRNPHK